MGGELRKSSARMWLSENFREIVSSPSPFLCLSPIFKIPMYLKKRLLHKHSLHRSPESSLWCSVTRFSGPLICFYVSFPNSPDSEDSFTKSTIVTIYFGTSINFWFVCEEQFITHLHSWQIYLICWGKPTNCKIKLFKENYRIIR